MSIADRIKEGDKLKKEIREREERKKQEYASQLRDLDEEERPVIRSKRTRKTRTSRRKR